MKNTLIVTGWLALALVTGSLVYGYVFLYFDNSSSLVLWGVSESVLFIFFIIAIIGFFRPRRRPFRKLRGNLTALLMPVMLTVAVSGAALLNFSIGVIADQVIKNTPKAKLALLTSTLQTVEASAIDKHSFENETKGSLSFYYNNETAAAPAMAAIRQAVQDAAARDQQFFGDLDEPPADVVLFPTHKGFLAHAGALKPENLGGYYRERNQTIAFDINQIDPFAVKHEYAHHLFFTYMKTHHLYATDLPQWFIEGTADAIAQYPRRTFKAVKDPEFSWLPLSDLTTERAWNNHAHIGYPESQLFMNYLIDLKGEHVVKNILLKADGGKFDQAFQTVIGMTPEAAWAQFNKQIVKSREILLEAQKANWARHPKKLYQLYLSQKPLFGNSPGYQQALYAPAMYTGHYKTAYHAAVLSWEKNKDILSAEQTAQSLIYENPEHANRFFQKAYKKLPRDEVYAPDQRFSKSLETLAANVQKGDPLKGYLYFFKHTSTPPASVSPMIDRLLKKYPDGEQEARQQLLELRNKEK